MLARLATKWTVALSTLVVSGSLVGLYLSRTQVPEAAPAPDLEAVRSRQNIEAVESQQTVAIEVPATPAPTAEPTVEEPLEVSEMIPASEPCQRPTLAQQRALRDRLAAWIDQRYAYELSDAATGLNTIFGCIESVGIVVDVRADRTTKGHEEGPDVGRFWTVRMTNDRITILAELQGVPACDWTEWVNATTTDTLALVDFDGDGAHDALFAHTQHEIGAAISDYDITLAFSNGRVKHVAHRELEINEAFTTPNGVELDVGGLDMPRGAYCIGADLRLRRCKATVLPDEDE